MEVNVPFTEGSMETATPVPSCSKAGNVSSAPQKKSAQASQVPAGSSGRGRAQPTRLTDNARKPGHSDEAVSLRGPEVSTEEKMEEAGLASDDDLLPSGAESLSSSAGSYAQVVHRGPVRPMVSTGTQTSTDDLRLPSRSPAPSGAVPVTPLSNRKVDAASSASTSGQGLTPPAPPGPSAPKGRGLPPRTSAPQRKPGESPKQTTSKGQLPAATDELMDAPLRPRNNLRGSRVPQVTLGAHSHPSRFRHNLRLTGSFVPMALLMMESEAVVPIPRRRPALTPEAPQKLTKSKAPQGAPVKAGVWRVASPRTPSHAGSPAHVWLCVAFPCPGKRASWWLSRARGRFGPFGAPRGSYAEAVRRGPARPVVSMGTQTSPDDLHLPSRSPSKPPRAAPMAPPPNRKVNAALPASAPEQEMSSPAQPAASTSRGRGLPPHTSAPQRKPGEVPKQSTSKGQLPATADEPMDEVRKGSPPSSAQGVEEAMEVNVPSTEGSMETATPVPSCSKAGNVSSAPQKKSAQASQVPAGSSGRGRAQPTRLTDNARKPGHSDEAVSLRGPEVSTEEKMEEAGLASDDDLLPSGAESLSSSAGSGPSFWASWQMVGLMGVQPAPSLNPSSVLADGWQGLWAAPLSDVPDAVVLLQLPST
ncbi:hypothetical protein ISCGN_016039 [Ixodes scapularis]